MLNPEQHSLHSNTDKHDDHTKDSIYHDLYHKKQTRDEWEEKPSRLKKLPFNLLYFLVGIAIPIAGFIIWVTLREHRKKDAIYVFTGTIIGTVLLVMMNIMRFYRG